MLCLHDSYSQETFYSKRYTEDGGRTYKYQNTDILVHPKEQKVTFTYDSSTLTYYIEDISETDTERTETSVIETITMYCKDKSGRRYNILFSIAFRPGRAPYYSVLVSDLSTKEQRIYL